MASIGKDPYWSKIPFFGTVGRRAAAAIKIKEVAGLSPTSLVLYYVVNPGRCAKPNQAKERLRDQFLVPFTTHEVLPKFWCKDQILKFTINESRRGKLCAGVAHPSTVLV